TGATKFTDDNMIQSWAQEGVYYCFRTGLVSGVGNGQYAPDRNATREQAVIVCNRASESGAAGINNNIQNKPQALYPGIPDLGIKDLNVSTSVDEALKIAQKYHQLAYPNIESDFQGEYRKTVTWQPTFNGQNTNTAIARTNSGNVAIMVSYTNAKNAYLALAGAVFSSDPKSPIAASNLASAIASYYDDLVLEGNGGGSDKKNQFYGDAVRMYYYAVGAAPVNKHDSPVILSSLGNLLLDMGRADNALAAFNAALGIDGSYWRARMGLYNYYMSQKQFDKALELIAKDAKYYPAFARTVSKVGQQISPEKLDLPAEFSEPAFETHMEKLKQVPAVTAGDFISGVDAQASAKMKKDIDNLQSKMVYKAPNVDYILQYASLEAMGTPQAQAALEAFSDAYAQTGMQTNGYDTEAIIKSQLDMLEQLGVDVDLGFDVNNTEEIINDAMKNPEKYENWDPQVNISGVENIADNAQDYLHRLQAATAQAKQGDPTQAYEELAKTRPEFKVMTLNPYSYANPNDLLIQRYNVLALSPKLTGYGSYLRNVNTKAGATIGEICAQYISKITPLITEYNGALMEIEDDSNLDGDQKLVKIHRLHVQYYTQFNHIGDPYWGQATREASVAYKKNSKYSEQMYNDCMKHIMLISDEKVRDQLEEELRSSISTNLKTAFSNILSAYTMAPYYNPAACDCPIEEIQALVEEMENERHRLANELIQKNMADKKNFDAGVLDENSQYYKEFIKKYECDFNFGVFKGKISPYKSNWQFGLDLPIASISLSGATNHIRNTTTFDGGLEVSGEVAGTGIKSSFGFTAARGSNGLFSPNDIDVRAGVEGSISSPFSDNVGLTAGVEASALRGTREYAQVTVTGSQQLDELKNKMKLDWLPSTSKDLWSGEYAEN
ncbi:MAG: S-layer homology domain-containing protein, partial [Syntrophomonas sp.]|nr:S-layer homology domain-containing protein [Syntrophomonas sp.]